MWISLTGTIDRQQWLFQEKTIGDKCLMAGRLRESDQGCQEMNKQYRDRSHHKMLGSKDPGYETENLSKVMVELGIRHAQQIPL